MLVMWPLAAVIVAALAWDVARRHIHTRSLWQEERIAALEAKADALKDVGAVLKSHALRLGGVERVLKNELVGGE